MARLVSDLAAPWTLALASALFSFAACRSPEARACSEHYETAQQQVRAVDAKSETSVRASLVVVEAALTTCRTAQRLDFVEQLTKVRNELTGQLGLLERRAKRKPRRPPSAEELQKLEKEGDPTCPRGQAYKPEGAKEIRCTGPQLVEMTAAQARAHFEERDHRVKSVPPATLEVERGSERTTLIYSAPGAASPDCVILFPPPGTTWQEAVSRATGANPAKLELGKAIASAHGPLPFSVDEKDVVIRIGRCPAR